MSANRQRRSSFPILDWIFGYQKDWVWCDLIAGLITAAVVIPKAMAYTTIAGLPVQVRLYTVTKAGRNACTRRPLSQRGCYVNRSRFLSGWSARNASRTESP